MIDRINRVRKAMQKDVLDGYLVSSPANLRYLTNFTGTAGIALITPDDAFFITDFRYMEQAAEQTSGLKILQHQGDIIGEISSLIDQKQLSSMGFEDQFVSFAEYSLYEEFFDVELAPASGLIERLREKKEQSEIETISKACQIADAAYEHVLKMIRPGMTEIEVANQLDFFMRSLGASGTSFETIVASGVRSALPHGVASNKVIAEGEMITLDFGCYYQGYVSDITRTFAIGDPGEKLKEIYHIVLTAQNMVLTEAKAGITGNQLDQVARTYISEQGYGEAFGHSTGHGIGLEIHEGPTISRMNEFSLEIGNVITDEPGIYIPDLGGVRIEDDLVVLENGNHALTHAPKELIIL
ncbi:peptidase M24 [Enterococcus florum]|uniref:Peptidase M24 n=1 Tax=Enterococcus florum TaxID=2480627 RepID=A0A4P5P7M4_9ENTE|nr:aminopeptidase P family protein [Enterococcus florum]GCF93985.1 peptidase M24 [Enterococcus florum]